MIRCKKCGNIYDENYGVCPKCGTVYEQVYVTEKTAAVKKKNTKSVQITVLSVAGVVIIGVIVALIMIFSQPDIQVQVDEQLSVGEKYLTEENYDEAIIAFKKAIDIQPNNPDLYIKLADAYIASDNTEEAVKILEEGMNKTSSADIEKKLNDLKSDMQYEEYMKEGQNALSNKIYDIAAENFEKASAVKPQEVEPYLSASECYIGEDDNDNAVKILEEGYEATKSEEIKEKLEALKTSLQPIYFDTIQEYNGSVYYTSTIQGCAISENASGPNSHFNLVCDFSSLGYKNLPISENVWSFAIYNDNIYYISSNGEYQLKSCDLNGNNTAVISDVAVWDYNENDETMKKTAVKLENNEIIFAVDKSGNIGYKSYNLKTGEISDLSESVEIKAENKLPSYMEETTIFDGGEYSIYYLKPGERTSENVNLILQRKDLVTGEVIETGYGFTAVA